MPTVEQVWRIMPRGTGLVAGESSIYNEVSWVVTLRPTPPGFDRLRGKEFALIDTATVTGLGITLSSLVTSLAEQSIGGLGILGEVIPEVKELAQTYKMPILQLPPSSDLGTLQVSITALITEERSRLYQQEQVLTQELMEMALAGRGLKAILDKLHNLSGRLVLLLDPDFTPSATLSEPKLSGVQKVISHALPSPPSTITGLKLVRGLSGFLSPVSGKQGTEGYLLVAAPSEELQESDRLVAKVGALALAVEMSRHQAVMDTEGRFQTEMFESLISGGLSSSAEAERAAKLGLNLQRRYVVMVVQSANPGKAEINVKQAKVALGEKARCFRSGNSLVILFEMANHSIEDMRRLKKETTQKLSGQFGGGISLGMGRSCIAADGLKTSFHEAEQALMIGKRLFGEGSASFFGDLGIYRLLLAVGVNELKSFYQESMGYLEEYDREHGGELVHTLEEILKYPTISETAQALHVHRNTLLYRIQRIQEISNVNLDDGENRLAFYLALKVRDVIRRS
jgi:purine catabolism regulator